MNALLALLLLTIIVLVILARGDIHVTVGGGTTAAGDGGQHDTSWMCGDGEHNYCAIVQGTFTVHARHELNDDVVRHQYLVFCTKCGASSTAGDEPHGSAKEEHA